MINKKCLGMIMLLLAVIVAGAYKFMSQGSTSQGSDGRTTLNLNAKEKNIVLTEMREFLKSVQQITQGITENNMLLVAESARKSGKTAQGAVPGTLVGKLPMTFKKLGFDTHKKFDQLALDATDLGDKEQALSQLSILMKNCVACHASYKIEVEKK